jgi:hypothetical protein
MAVLVWKTGIKILVGGVGNTRLSLVLSVYLLLLISLQLSGCATTYTVNPPLKLIDQAAAYNYRSEPAVAFSDARLTSHPDASR